MKPDILASGFMTTWWLTVFLVWLLPQVWCPRSMATGSRPTGGTAVSWAHLLAKGMLKRVWVPSEEELYHRQVIRRRRQLVRDRVRTQSRIKAELRFHGVHLEEPRGRWTQGYFETLRHT